VFFVGHSEHNGPSSSEITRSTDSTSNQQQERQKKTCQSKGTGLPGGCGVVADTTDGNEQKQQECNNWEKYEWRTQVGFGFRAGRGSKDGDSSERVEIGSGVTTEVSEDVADTDNGSWIVRRDGQFPAIAEAERTWIDNRGRTPEHVAREWWTTEPRLGGMANGISYWLDGYWRVEPNIPRVATGVKNRVDRLKCLGNAVVPQQVYPILKAIAEIEKGKRG
jgi:hypothetical protein